MSIPSYEDRPEIIMTALPYAADLPLPNYATAGSAGLDLRRFIVWYFVFTHYILVLGFLFGTRYAVISQFLGKEKPARNRSRG